jgi:hypothetical protein
VQPGRLDLHRFILAAKLPLGENPDGGLVSLEQPLGIAERGGGAERAAEIDGERAQPGKKAIVLELLLFHHAVARLVRHLPGEDVDHESVPPIGVIAKEKDGAIGGKLAQVLQAATGQGVKGAPGQPPKVDEKQRIQDVVFIRSNHNTF